MVGIRWPWVAIVSAVAMAAPTSGVAAAPEARQATGSPARAAPSWGPVERIDEGAIGTPDLAVDRSGRATVVYQRGAGVFAARDTGDGWGSPVRIGAGRNPEVAVDAAGNATAIWTGDGFRVQAADRPVRGSWSRPRFLSPPNRGWEDVIVGAFNSSLAVNRAGDAVVAWDVWSYDDPAIAERVLARHRPAGGPWSRPVALDGSTGRPGNPVTAVRPRGQALVLYASERRLVAQDRLLGAGWSPPRVIDADYRGTTALLGVGRDDEAAAWDDGRRETSPVKLAWRRNSGSWSREETVFGDDATLVDLNVAASGRATVAASDLEHLWTREVLPTTSLRRPRLVDDVAGEDLWATSMGGNRRGDVLLAWYSGTRGNQGTYASYRARGDDWTDPVEVVAGVPATAVGDDGDGVLVWASRGGALLTRRLQSR